MPGQASVASLVLISLTWLAVQSAPLVIRPKQAREWSTVTEGDGRLPSQSGSLERQRSVISNYGLPDVEHPSRVVYGYGPPVQRRQSRVISGYGQPVHHQWSVSHRMNEAERRGVKPGTRDRSAQLVLSVLNTADHRGEQDHSDGGRSLPLAGINDDYISSAGANEVTFDTTRDDINEKHVINTGIQSKMSLENGFVYEDVDDDADDDGEDGDEDLLTMKMDGRWLEDYPKVNDNAEKHELVLDHQDKMQSDSTGMRSPDVVIDTSTRDQCPPSAEIMVPGCDVTKCSSDGDCLDGQLCCYNGCTFTCINHLSHQAALMDWSVEPKRHKSGRAWLVEVSEKEEANLNQGEPCSTSEQVQGDEDALLCSQGYICKIEHPGDPSRDIPNRGHCILIEVTAFE